MAMGLWSCDEPRQQVTLAESSKLPRISSRRDKLSQPMGIFPKGENTSPEKTNEKSKKNIDYDSTQWREILPLSGSLYLDLRYAGEDNFVEEKLYDCARCFLRPVAAEALLEIHRQLQAEGMGLKIFDCYRPLSVQKRLWEILPNPSYVTSPAKGSMHNRGLAVDLTLTDSLGNELDMGTTFDFFGRKAHHSYTDFPEEVLNNRRLLKERMESVGFYPIRTEWWHYSYRKTRFKVDDMLWGCD